METREGGEREREGERKRHTSGKLGVFSQPMHTWCTTKYIHFHAHISWCKREIKTYWEEDKARWGREAKGEGG